MEKDILDFLATNESPVDQINVPNEQKIRKSEIRIKKSEIGIKKCWSRVNWHNKTDFHMVNCEVVNGNTYKIYSIISM